MDKMDFHEFKIWALDSVRSYLPEEYADAQIDFYPVVKAGVRYTGMTVRQKEQQAVPAVNLEDAYHHYLLDMPLDAVGERMAEIVMAKLPQFDKDLFKDYETVKDRLFIRVCSRENNPELMANVPHKDIRDLAVTYHILVRTSEEGISSALIDNNLLENLGISKERLHEDALANSEKILPARIETLEKTLERLGKPPGFTISEEASSMQVITNALGIDGASALFYPGVADKLAKEIGGSYYILPSSIHELIVVPCSSKRDWRELEMTVFQVNRMEVPREDRLSDHVYRYSARERSFDLAKNVEERNKERGREYAL